MRIVLFVKTKNDIELTKELETEIKRTIKEGASDAHVPALLKQVKKIPYTRSGKKVELAVKDLISGVEPKNVGALVASAFDRISRDGAHLEVVRIGSPPSPSVDGRPAKNRRHQSATTLVGDRHSSLRARWESNAPRQSGSGEYTQKCDYADASMAAGEPSRDAMAFFAAA